MTDWKLVAAGRGLDIPDEELARMSAVLMPLEESFRPLVRTIRLETEPAVTFTCAPLEKP